MIGSLAEQYYNLVWRAVREGLNVFSDIWGEAPRTLRDLYKFASTHESDSVALRFYVSALFTASRLLAEIVDSLSELPEACEWIYGPARETVALAEALLRDTRQEVALYTSGRPYALLLERVLKALRETAQGVVECCERGGVKECLG